jgi:hypothetical protein
MSRKKAQEDLEQSEAAASGPDARAFVKRLIEDAELRDAVGRAIESSRTAYERVAKARKPHKLADDEKLHAQVQEAIDALRQAAAGLGEAPREQARKGRRFGRKVFILVLGGGLALVASEDLRSKVLDKLFGAEEEFEYTPPAGNGAPPVPAAATAAPSAEESVTDGASAGEE